MLSYLIEVAVIAVVEGGHVDVDDVAVLQLPHVRDAVADHLPTRKKKTHMSQRSGHVQEAEKGDLAVTSRGSILQRYNSMGHMGR